MTVTEVIIALGGNVGDVTATMERCLDTLEQHPQVSVKSKSRIYKTSPVGRDAGGSFLNSAAIIETTLGPLQLLDVLQKIEYEEGRERTSRWTPRPIDLDLIQFGDQVIEETRLTVPHAACFYRRFVLDPVVEIAGETVHPGFGKTYRELRERLLRRPVIVDVHEAPQIRTQLSEMFDERLVRFVAGDPDATLLVHLPGTECALPHAVRIHPREDLSHEVHQILIAVTDEPVPIGD